MAGHKVHAWCVAMPVNEAGPSSASQLVCDIQREHKFFPLQGWQTTLINPTTPEVEGGPWVYIPACVRLDNAGLFATAACLISSERFVRTGRRQYMPEMGGQCVNA